MCKTLFVKNYVKPTTVNMAEEKVVKMRTLLGMVGFITLACALMLLVVQAFVALCALILVLLGVLLWCYPEPYQLNPAVPGTLEITARIIETTNNTTVTTGDLVINGIVYPLTENTRTFITQHLHEGTTTHLLVLTRYNTVEAVGVILDNTPYSEYEHICDTAADTYMVGEENLTPNTKLDNLTIRLFGRT